MTPILPAATFKSFGVADERSVVASYSCLQMALIVEPGPVFTCICGSGIDSCVHTLSERHHAGTPDCSIF
ncbi:hypothetical protein M404DRAFT_391124 [Pisolithus tinctorius Marx 270]|uniref:Uncharacterized protein n=1 Tax=Pisolithus tinctorius Marx 270 TaxID=870435 RepID=A0A0C3JF22_PISTI|nr:hypothetical protein M404DRAFT_391124 [Pisolithus tinctorius Marx 270]